MIWLCGYFQYYFGSKALQSIQFTVTSNFMKTATDIQNIIEKYKDGHRHFINLDFDKGEKLTEQILSDSTFDNCCFSVDFSQTDFSNAKFINCNLKCSDFSNCNLTNSGFENCSLESAKFKNAQIEGISMINCYCYGQLVSINNETGELETFKDNFIKELFDNVLEFKKMTDHSNDDQPYVVYGELSLLLLEDIKNNSEITDFTKKAFQFFNKLGNRNDSETDNLLIVGIYEGLYADKKCNQIARQLLLDRNKEVYEYWMINGNIRSDYE